MKKFPVSILMMQFEPILEILGLVRKMGRGVPGCLGAGVPGCRGAGVGGIHEASRPMENKGFRGLWKTRGAKHR